MSVLECSAEVEIFFKTNWYLTETQFPDPSTPFDNSDLDLYIRMDYIPTNNESSGMGRISSYGTSQIFCYHKRKKLALKLADDIKKFFNCTSLPKDIFVGIGDDIPCVDLDNGFYMALVQFPVSQHS